MNGNIKKAALFIGLTFLFDWTLAGLFFVFGGELSGPTGRGMLAFYMFLPMAVAIIVQKFIYKEPLKKPLGISFKLNRWFLVAWLLPPLIAFAAFGVGLLFPGVGYSPEMAGLFEKLQQSAFTTPNQIAQMKEQFANYPIHPIWIFLLQWLIAGITINAVFGFGEELGWRGLLQREFRYMGFWKSSTIIGVIWGIWHVPLILQGYNYPQHPVIGIFMITILCVLLSPIFSYVRLKANSVIAAAIIHGSFNATAGLSFIMLEGGNDLTVGVLGLAGFIVLAIVNLGIFAHDRFLPGEIGATGNGGWRQPL